MKPPTHPTSCSSMTCPKGDGKTLGAPSLRKEGAVDPSVSPNPFSAAEMMRKGSIPQRTTRSVCVAPTWIQSSTIWKSAHCHTVCNAHCRISKDSIMYVPRHMNWGLPPPLLLPRPPALSPRRLHHSPQHNLMISLLRKHLRPANKLNAGAQGYV